MRDQWGRVLVHADLPGGICVNESLLAEGLARVDERWPHQRLDRYDDAAARARAAGRGIWSSRAAAARDE
jgi:endonuclease YncB( thermonuclease family)